MIVLHDKGFLVIMGYILSYLFYFLRFLILTGGYKTMTQSGKKKKRVKLTIIQCQRYVKHVKLRNASYKGGDEDNVKVVLSKSTHLGVSVYVDAPRILNDHTVSGSHTKLI